VTSNAYGNDKRVHTIHEFSPNVAPRYKMSESPANHLLANHRMKYFGFDASSISMDDCSTFEEKKSPSDCTYDGYGNNARVFVYARRMRCLC